MNSRDWKLQITQGSINYERSNQQFEFTGQKSQCREFGQNDVNWVRDPSLHLGLWLSGGFEAEEAFFFVLLPPSLSSKDNGGPKLI